MNQEEFEKFFAKLENIETLCKLYEVLKPMRAFNEANSKLNDYDVSRLENQLRKRGEGMLVDNLERVAQLGGDAYYGPIYDRILNLKMRLEKEILDLNVDVEDSYQVQENSLIMFSSDNGYPIVYLYCPEGESREEVKAILGEDEFKLTFDEKSYLENISGSSQRSSDLDEFPEYIPFRTPPGTIGDFATWINTIDMLISKSPLYQKALEMREDEE